MDASLAALFGLWDWTMLKWYVIPLLWGAIFAVPIIMNIFARAVLGWRY
jgi:hypothetical protein